MSSDYRDFAVDDNVEELDIALPNKLSATDSFCNSITRNFTAAVAGFFPTGFLTLIFSENATAAITVGGLTSSFLVINETCNMLTGRSYSIFEVPFAPKDENDTNINDGSRAEKLGAVLSLVGIPVGAAILFNALTTDSSDLPASFLNTPAPIVQKYKPH